MTDRSFGSVSRLKRATIRETLVNFCAGYANDIDLDEAEKDIREAIQKNLDPLGITLAGDELYADHRADIDPGDLCAALELDFDAYSEIVKRHDSTLKGNEDDDPTNRA